MDYPDDDMLDFYDPADDIDYDEIDFVDNDIEIDAVRALYDAYDASSESSSVVSDDTSYEASFDVSSVV